MTAATHAAAAWVYRGVWGVLSRWFHVPQAPPTLPFHDAEGPGAVESFRPADAYLRYLKLQFWLFVSLVATVAATAWIIALVATPIVAIVLALPVAPVLLAGTAGGYLALHLRFDTTWYVLTDRSLRIRRGMWVIRETTITFENIQNVSVSQGPLQRLFGISDVLVQTAGGGTRRGPHGEELLGPHAGVFEGLSDAPRVRDLVQARLTASKSAGLGDEARASEAGHAGGMGWTPRHLAVLREIRDRVRALA